VLALILGGMIALWPRDALGQFSRNVVKRESTSLTFHGTAAVFPASSMKDGNYDQRKTILRDVAFADVERALRRNYSPLKGFQWRAEENGFFAEGEKGRVAVFPGNYQNQPSVSVVETVRLSRLDLWKMRLGLK
jgi:hypothetical protein